MNVVSHYLQVEKRRLDKVCKLVISERMLNSQTFNIGSGATPTTAPDNN